MMSPSITSQCINEIFPLVPVQRELLPALAWGPLSGHYLPVLVTQPTSLGRLTMSPFRDLRCGHELDFLAFGLFLSG